MEEIHIAGTGIWHGEHEITNDEIVASFNSYVDKFNSENSDEISKGNIEQLLHSSSEFIEKASGIKFFTYGIILLISRIPSFSITYLVFIPDAFSINSEDE